jgi:hypothetical protein
MQSCQHLVSQPIIGNSQIFRPVGFFACSEISMSCKVSGIIPLKEKFKAKELYLELVESLKGTDIVLDSTEPSS